MNGYSCQNDIFLFRKVWRLRKRDQDVFSCFFSFRAPQKKLDTPNIHKSPWKIQHFDGIKSREADERFSMVLCFFRVLGGSESCLFLLATKKWSPKGTPTEMGHRTNVRHSGSTWRPMGAAALRIVESEQVTERRLTLSPRNGSEKNWVYLQKGSG